MKGFTSGMRNFDEYPKLVIYMSFWRPIFWALGGQIVPRITILEVIYIINPNPSLVLTSKFNKLSTIFQRA